MIPATISWVNYGCSPGSNWTQESSTTPTSIMTTTTRTIQKEEQQQHCRHDSYRMDMIKHHGKRSKGPSCQKTTSLTTSAPPRAAPLSSSMDEVLNQACDIVLSSLHKPDFASAGDNKAIKYRRDLLTDDLGMFREQLSMFRQDRMRNNRIQ